MHGGPSTSRRGLVQFGSQPDTTYSDFFGFAPYWTSWTWFTVYWLTFCGLLAVASILLWQRGRERGWGMRWRAARLRFTAPWRALTFALLAVFVGTGAWIYYNTEVLNTILSEDDRDRMSADYEKTYKKYEGVPQPRFIDVKYKIDLFPERRAATMHADTIIQNKTSQPISVLHVNYPGPDFQSQIQIDGARVKQDDRRLQYRIYALDPPMQPGEQRHFRFTTSREPRGFENTVSVLQMVQNGTFFNNADVSPQIGYQPVARTRQQEPPQEVRAEGKGPDAGAGTQLHRRLHGHLPQQQFRLGERGNRNLHFARTDRRSARIAGV